MTSEAQDTLRRLLAGEKCCPSAEVCSELGRIGLAHRFDLRNFADHRIVLTMEGARNGCKYLHDPTLAQA